MVGYIVFMGEAVTVLAPDGAVLHRFVPTGMPPPEDMQRRMRENLTPGRDNVRSPIKGWTRIPPKWEVDGCPPCTLFLKTSCVFTM